MTSMCITLVAESLLNRLVKKCELSVLNCAFHYLSLSPDSSCKHSQSPNLRTDRKC